MTVEQSIGEVGHKIRSKKSPFANLVNIITEKKLLHILKLYYPLLSVHSSILDPNNEESEPEETNQAEGPPQTKLIQKIRLTKKDLEESFMTKELESVERHSKIDFNKPGSGTTVERWGKAGW